MEKWKDRKIAELAYNLNLFDVEEILDVAIKQIPTIVNAHRIAIYIMDQEENHFIFKRHSSKKIQDSVTENISTESRKSLIPQILLKNKPLLITNIQEYAEKNGLDITLSKQQRYTSGSCMLIPLKVKLLNDHEKLLGVINFAEKNDFTPFTKHDLLLATHVGEILATALHNCNVIEKKLGGRQKELMAELDHIKEAYSQKDIKLDEAKKKQNQMLPELPNIPNYEIDVQYTPMETIGGDFYDFIPIKENEIGIVVGDVSGHGIEAALVMSMAKQILRIYSKLYGSLSEILIHANDEICTNLNGESFVAVFLGILNTETHIFRYARAGQPYPLLCNASRPGNAFELKTEGVVLGTLRGELFRSKIEENSVQLTANDVFLLYTDGVIEAPSPGGDDFSVERLAKFLTEFSSRNPREIVSLIYKEVCDFLQGPPADDITLLCIKALDIKPVIPKDQEGYQDGVMSEAESYIVSPELTFDQEVHYEMLALEEKIADYETEIQELQHEKLQLEEKCQELNIMLDLAESDPDSLLNMLRQQLKVALDLPKQLIPENERLHLEIEKMKRELSAQELEINDWMQHNEILRGKYEETQEKYNELRKKYEEKERVKNGFQKSSRAILSELLGSATYFDPKVIELLKNEDYKGALDKLENLLNIAFERMDIAHLLSLQQQMFTICRSFFHHL